MQYKPGLHLLLNIKTSSVNELSLSLSWKNFIADQISKFKLTTVGEAFHEFEGGGFTAIHGLTESHVSIHTWPEYNYCTCDIFLSNYKNENSNIVKEIGKAVVDFYKSTDFEWKEIER
ncbi:MAG TPA: S-adenosylmethionine decarboxylase [Bacteroidia bacterium]|nr:S-adenosylmethionine decarboxylase [Bacteroidia bacterium]